MQKSKKFHLPVEKVILALAAGFAAYNFGLAGGYIEGTHFSAGGLIAGVVVNITIAVASSRMGGLKGKTRTRQAWTALIGLMSLSPVLVAPVIYYSLPETFLGGGILRASWAIGWALAADLAIVLAGAAVSGKGLIALSDAGTAQSDAGAQESAPTAVAVPAHKKRSADAVREKCAALSAQYACKEAQCGWSPSVDALVEGARAGKNPKNAAASAKAGHVKNQHPKPIAIDQSLLIHKEQS
jgi:hypothetical protein